MAREDDLVTMLGGLYDIENAQQVTDQIRNILEHSPKADGFYNNMQNLLMRGDVEAILGNALQAAGFEMDGDINTFIAALENEQFLDYIIATPSTQQEVLDAISQLTANPPIEDMGKAQRIANELFCALSKQIETDLKSADKDAYKIIICGERHRSAGCFLVENMLLEICKKHSISVLGIEQPQWNAPTFDTSNPIPVDNLQNRGNKQRFGEDNYIANKRNLLDRAQRLGYKLLYCDNITREQLSQVEAEVKQGKDTFGDYNDKREPYMVNQLAGKNAIFVTGEKHAEPVAEGILEKGQNHAIIVMLAADMYTPSLEGEKKVNVSEQGNCVTIKTAINLDYLAPKEVASMTDKANMASVCADVARINVKTLRDLNGVRDEIKAGKLRPMQSTPAIFSSSVTPDPTPQRGRPRSQTI